MIDDLGGIESRVEVLKSAKPDAVHPLQIQFDSFFGDVPVHPVPPNAGPSAFRRIFKSALEGISRVLLLGYGWSYTYQKDGQGESYCLGIHCFPL
jgi:hypothetical protein